MPTVHNTVFISYRRETSAFIARAIFMDLRLHKYDVFMDVESIHSGEFESVILEQLSTRAHFLLILTAGTLERCENPKDWVRREIEEAIRTKRNIIPILVNDFQFKNIETLPTESLRELSKYNALTLPHEYFDAAMERLRRKFLAVPIEIHAPSTHQQPTHTIIKALEQLPVPSQNELTAESLYNDASEKYVMGHYEDAIQDYSKAIELNPEYGTAYYSRGIVFAKLDQYDKCIADYSTAIKKGIQTAAIYYNRANAYIELEKYNEAVHDYDETLRINPTFRAAQQNRDLALQKLKP